MQRCAEHPKYKGIYKPRSTEKHPNGCANCWRIWHFLRSINTSPIENFKGGLITWKPKMPLNYGAEGE